MITKIVSNQLGYLFNESRAEGLRESRSIEELTTEN